MDCRAGSVTSSRRGFGLDIALVWSLRLYGAAALLILAFVPKFFLPAEDAVILFQYSHNLAHHGTIAYLTGGRPTEGATDFAWMALLALAISADFRRFPCTALANVVSLLGLGAILSKLAKLPVRPAHLLAACGAAALFPQICAAASGFGVLPVALLLAATFYFTVNGRVAWTAGCALMLCLFRPDGVVFAVPLLAWMAASTRRWRDAAAIAAFFAVPGTIYFLWRWRYFSELLPLPFLVKSDTPRVFGLFVTHSARSSFIFLLFAGAMLCVLWERRRRHIGTLILCFMVVPTLFYASLRLDQNVGDRFFFYLPTGTACLVAWHWERLAGRRTVLLRSAFAAWAILIAMPLYREIRTFKDMQFDEVKAIGEDLGRMERHGTPATIATSEAGFLPFYSGWFTIDLWGLNEPRFAHRFFQPADLRSLVPDLVVVHPDKAESCVAQPSWENGYRERSWPHLSRNIVIATGTQYDLWLTSYGSEYYRRRKHWNYGEVDRECWFVRKDSPLRDMLSDVLKAHHGVPPDAARQLEAARRGAAAVN